MPLIPLHTITTHYKSLITPNGKYVIHSTNVYDAISGNKVHELGGVINALSRDGKSIATFIEDPIDMTYEIQIWEVGTWVKLIKISDVKADIEAIAWSPDGSLLAAAGVDRRTQGWPKSIRIWRVESGKHELLLKVSTGADSLEFSEDGRQLLVCDGF